MIQAAGPDLRFTSMTVWQRVNYTGGQPNVDSQRMPRADMGGKLCCKPPSPAEHQNRVEDFTILIVEDHGVIAADLADAVRRSGGQVLGPVSRLSEALAVIATAPCDAALLDINLGHETAYLKRDDLNLNRLRIPKSGRV